MLNREIFLKRKAIALFNRVERLVHSLSSSALSLCDDSSLHVKLELIDELQESFKRVLGELEELDFEEIESDFLLTASLRKFSAPSSVSLDIGQHCCSHLSFQNSLEVMQGGLIFILCLPR